MPARAAFACVLLLTTVVWPSFGRAGEKSHDHARHMGVQQNGTPATKAAAAAPRLVRFPARLRDRTLTNMRDHLLALAEIEDQLAGQHYEIAAEIAEQRLGMSSLKLHGAHEVAEYMPQGMQDAGTAMHHAASRFALAAEESAVDRDMNKSLAALATLTRACVACHAAYRLR